MSCIIGIKTQNEILIGGDSCGSTIYEDHIVSRLRRDPKVFWNGSVLVGSCGSPRVCQCLHPNVWVPNESNIHNLIISMKDCLEEQGTLFSENGIDSMDSELLIAYGDKLYSIQRDFQYVELYDDYMAIGSGSSYALGNLYSTQDNKDPSLRIHSALECAEYFCPLVKQPFIILTYNMKKKENEQPNSNKVGKKKSIFE